MRPRAVSWATLAEVAKWFAALFSCWGQPREGGLVLEVGVGFAGAGFPLWVVGAERGGWRPWPSRQSLLRRSAGFGCRGAR